MSIYEKPTIKANNYNEIAFFLKKFKKEKINIFYSLDFLQYFQLTSLRDFM